MSFCNKNAIIFIWPIAFDITKKCEWKRSTRGIKIRVHIFKHYLMFSVYTENFLSRGLFNYVHFVLLSSQQLFIQSSLSFSFFFSIKKKRNKRLDAAFNHTMKHVAWWYPHVVFSMYDLLQSTSRKSMIMMIFAFEISLKGPALHEYRVSSPPFEQHVTEFMYLDSLVSSKFFLNHNFSSAF
jgi:hypothetical protein